MLFNTSDIRRDQYMLTGSLRQKGYDWWWHSFTGIDRETGAEQPFFVEFFVCNPALGTDRPIFGQLPQNRAAGVRPSYLMVKAGTWGERKCQLHRFFGWDDVAIHAKAPYEVCADDCYASETLLKGSIRISAEDASAHPEWMCDSGEMSWELTVDKQVAFQVGYGASTFFRAIKAFEMYWHAEGMKTLYSGTVTLNGRIYDIRPESCYGYADKNWGRNFTSPWVWLSSCNLTSKLTGKQLTNSVFDIGGGRPKIYFLPLNRKLLGAFWYEGTCYEFNFSKFWTGTKTFFSSEETDTEVIWHVRQENRSAVMETKVHAQKADLLLVNYEAPDGTKRHNKLWNGGNGTGTIRLYRKTKGNTELIDEIDVKNIGCEYGEYC